jgi:23S rRNA pseudouridine2605 synthase
VRSAAKRPSAERLQKVMAERGVASRRAAEALITAGRVRVEGRVVRVLGTRVAPDARIEVDGEAARPVGFRYLALNKPAGVVSTARDERGRPTVVALVRARERLYPVGRLDRDSEGLLLLTNDGEWAQRVIHPSGGHEREYEADVEGPLGEDALGRLARGVRLEEGLARLASVRVVARSQAGGRLRLVLRTGWKRQVRRMCAAVGLRVVRLRRVRIGPLRLGSLPAGAHRELTRREVEALGRA